MVSGYNGIDRSGRSHIVLIATIDGEEYIVSFSE